MTDPQRAAETPPVVAPPPITDPMRAQARQQPGGWIYVIDPAFDQTGDVPGWGVAGGYPVDTAGEIRPEFTANPDYRPSPLALGMARPVNELEGALQLAATGYGSSDTLLAALLAADVVVPARSAQDSSVPVFRDKEGRSVVPVFSSDQRVPADVAGYRTVPMTDLLSALPGRYLAVDPGARVSLTLPGEQVIEAGTARPDPGTG
jgi:hypothetical protein